MSLQLTSLCSKLPTLACLLQFMEALEGMVDQLQMVKKREMNYLLMKSKHWKFKTSRIQFQYTNWFSRRKIREPQELFPPATSGKSLNVFLPPETKALWWGCLSQTILASTVSQMDPLGPRASWEASLRSQIPSNSPHLNQCWTNKKTASKVSNLAQAASESPRAEWVENGNNQLSWN